MAKKQRSMGMQQMYSRQTKAFQQNMAKNMAEMQAPAMPQRKQTIIINIIVVVILIAMAVVLNILLSWWTVIIPVILAFAYVIFFGRHMNSKQMELMAYYQKMGIPKKTLMKQVQRQTTKQRDIDTYSRIWDMVAGKEGIKLSFIEKLMGYKIGGK